MAAPVTIRRGCDNLWMSPRAVVDMTGQRFGRLTVVERAESPRPGTGAFWLCGCECGNAKVVYSGHLRAGSTTSCGCFQREFTSAQKRRHGLHNAPEYLAWREAKARCGRSTHAQWRDYGGRGIAMCEEWRRDFVAFYEHIGPRPEGAYSLDRIDNDGHYEPGNVRWATRSQQAANTRPRFRDELGRFDSRRCL